MNMKLIILNQKNLYKSSVLAAGDPRWEYSAPQSQRNIYNHPVAFKKFIISRFHSVPSPLDQFSPYQGMATFIFAATGYLKVSFLSSATPSFKIICE
jgi:hypothetical protein